MGIQLSQKSQVSLNKVGLEFASEITNLSEKDALRVGQELFSFVEGIARGHRILRSLSDPTRIQKDKQKLIDDLLKPIKAHLLTHKIIGSLSAQKWSKPRDLTGSIGEFGFNAVLVSLSKRNDPKTLEKVESELYVFEETLKDMSKSNDNITTIRTILSDPNISLSGRFAIIEQLIGKKVDPATLILAKYACLILTSGRYVTQLQNVGEKIAEARSLKVVDIVAATEFTSSQRDRLEASLEKKYNQKIQMNILVDPSVLGGLKIITDGKVFDTTLLSQYNKFVSEFELGFRA